MASPGPADKFLHATHLADPASRCTSSITSSPSIQLEISNLQVKLEVVELVVVLVVLLVVVAAELET